MSSWGQLNGNLYKAKNPKPFILVPLIDLINNNTAKEIWNSCQKECGVTPFAAYRIISKPTDAYITTGDVIVPYTRNFDMTLEILMPIVLKKLNIQVLFVLNDRTYCEHISPIDWKNRITDHGSKNPRDLILFAVGNRDNYNGSVVLGDAVENTRTFDSN